MKSEPIKGDRGRSAPQVPHEHLHHLLDVGIVGELVGPLVEWRDLRVRAARDLPETLDDNDIVVRVQADAGGVAQIIGESLESADPGAFINGLRVAVPEVGPAGLLAVAWVLVARRRRSSR